MQQREDAKHSLTLSTLPLCVFECVTAWPVSRLSSSGVVFLPSATATLLTYTHTRTQTCTHTLSIHVILCHHKTCFSFSFSSLFSSLHFLYRNSLLGLPSPSADKDVCCLFVSAFLVYFCVLAFIFVKETKEAGFA